MSTDDTGLLALVLGGARSGKSRFAQSLCEAAPGPVGYVATARVDDDEMAARVEAHRRSRPSEWQTFECDTDLAACIRQASDCPTLLIDCVTIHVARLLEPFFEAGAGEDEAWPPVSDALDAAIEALRSQRMNAVLVSNDVGSGVVPAYPSGRLFRDVTGRANRLLAARCNRAYYVVAGVPLDLHALMARELPWPTPDAD